MTVICAGTANAETRFAGSDRFNYSILHNQVTVLHLIQVAESRFVRVIINVSVFHNSENVQELFFILHRINLLLGHHWAGRQFSRDHQCLIGKRKVNIFGENSIIRSRVPFRWMKFGKNVPDGTSLNSCGSLSHIDYFGWKQMGNRQYVNQVLWNGGTVISQRVKLDLSQMRRDANPCSLRTDDMVGLHERSIGGFLRGCRLPFNGFEGFVSNSYGQEASQNQKAIESPQYPIGPIPTYRHGGKFADRYGLFCIFGLWSASGVLVLIGWNRIENGKRWSGWSFIVLGLVCNGVGSASGAIGCLPWDWGPCLGDGQEHSKQEPFHNGVNVPQKYSLTSSNYWGTVIGIGDMQMPNVLSTDKQVAVISALAEGSGIRQIERITGVHRDTIMRLGVRVGKGCARLLDRKMRNLSCQHLQFDEIWGFIGKKERHCTVDDTPELGDVWTFCAIDSDTKIVPSFKVGKRDSVTANAFVSDVASRVTNRVQISSDALRAYIDAVDNAFGSNVDFAQVIKSYVQSESQVISERKYSAADFVIEEKKAIMGFPNMRIASTSHIERLNGTTRLHMRRLTRLTYAFSKKRENFEAAVALHFAYYNFVKRHNTLRATPAMAAGIERDFWTVGDLVEAAA